MIFSSTRVTLSEVGPLYAPLYMQENKQVMSNQVMSNLYNGYLIMMKQKLSPVKYETAFVPPNYIYFRQKKKNNHQLNTLLPLVLG